jgi:hypothetical protein
MVVFLASCSKGRNNDPLYETFGVIKEDINVSGRLYVRSDNGKAVVPSDSGLLKNDDKDSRVWVMFSTNDDVNSDTIRAFVNGLLVVTEMEFKTENDELTSDNVSLQEMWVAQDYLTMIMNVEANSEKSLKDHKYTMYSSKEIVNDTVRMEFKYSRNNDSGGARFNKIVALKLNDKLTVAPGSDSVVVAVKYRTGSSSRESFVKYKK